MAKAIKPYRAPKHTKMPSSKVSAKMKTSFKKPTHIGVKTKKSGVKFLNLKSYRKK